MAMTQADAKERQIAYLKVANDELYPGIIEMAWVGGRQYTYSIAAELLGKCATRRETLPDPDDAEHDAEQYTDALWAIGNEIIRLGNPESLDLPIRFCIRFHCRALSQHSVRNYWEVRQVLAANRKTHSTCTVDDLSDLSQVRLADINEGKTNE